MGIVTALVVIAVWVLRRQWTQYVIGATAVFPQTAALVIGTNGFPLFYLAVVLLAVLSIPYLLAAIAHPDRVPALRRGIPVLPYVLAGVLLAWAVFISLVGPRVFAGTMVFAPELGIGGVDVMVGLVPSLGNLAQVGYLAIAVTFLLLAGRVFPVDTRLLGVMLWGAVGLAAIRIVAEPVWPRELLQNMPGFNYATPERLSGTLHEPSVLGLYLVAAAAYFVVRLRQPGVERIVSVFALALVAVDFVFNSSGTALLGLGLLAAVAAVRMIASGRIQVRPLAVGAVVIAAGASLTQLPLLYSMTVGYAAQKTQTESFDDRGSSNWESLRILFESWGAGVGLGSNRPSSLLFLVISCLGVVGLGLLVAIVVLALKSAAAKPDGAAAAWTLIAILVAAGVAVPDLSSPALWAAVAACLAPVVVRIRRGTRRSNPLVNPMVSARDTPPVRVIEGTLSGGIGNSVQVPDSPAAPLSSLAPTFVARLARTLPDDRWTRVTPKESA